MVPNEMMELKIDVNFPCGTQLSFGSLTFATREDGDLKMLPPGPTPEQLALTSSSASGRSCIGSGCCAGNYIRTAKIVWGIPVVTSILRPMAGASSSSTSVLTPDSDLFDDYPKIDASACGEPRKDGRFIYIVALNGDRSSNTSSKYPTIERSEASDAQTLSGGFTQNLNSDFNAIQVHAIMETIRRMTPDGCPLAVLAQQGAEAANLIVVEKSIGVPQREPSVGGNDWARCARSEAASSVSPNCDLSKHDAQWCITQSRTAREYGRERDDLYNVIEDRRHLRCRTLSPP
jgi:hypothetical protein